MHEVEILDSRKIYLAFLYIFYQSIYLIYISICLYRAVGAFFRLEGHQFVAKT